MPRDIGSV